MLAYAKPAPGAPPGACDAAIATSSSGALSGILGCDSRMLRIIAWAEGAAWGGLRHRISYKMPPSR